MCVCGGGGFAKRLGQVGLIRIFITEAVEAEFLTEELPWLPHMWLRDAKLAAKLIEKNLN